ncbi:Hypothetical predicted protein [Lecanosticta acicola]|uniref:Uncharacterized protein n=1 Tax=Lecanosticta acicola TaxID=111012 RepID=A0AAI9EE25_9PEZI|nr:Hypothetical predicted protein [Lecanosticta acicola]
MAPVPIALCGKHADMADAFISGMLPEFEVVHVCHSAPVAISELRALLRGERTEPASGRGTNFKTAEAAKAPKAIFVGGGFAPSELDEMRSVEELQRVPWLYPSAARRAAGEQARGNLAPPPMDIILGRAKGAMKEKGLLDAPDGHGSGILWEY